MNKLKKQIYVSDFLQNHWRVTKKSAANFFATQNRCGNNKYLFIMSGVNDPKGKL